MAGEFQVTDQGITNHKLLTIRGFIVSLYKSKYGDEGQSSSDSYDGLVIDTLSLLSQMLQEGIVEAFNNSFFRFSSGNSVDLILDLFNCKRLAAKASTVSLVFYGTHLTVVPQDTLASVSATERAFGSNADVTLIEQGDPLAETTMVLIDGVDGTGTVNVTIGGLSHTHAVTPSQGNEEARDALILLIAANVAPVQSFSGGTDENGAARLVIDHDIAGQTVTTTTGARTTIIAAARAAATCTVTGPVQAFAGNLDTLTTPVFGVQGVTTTADAIVGRNRETDSEYKTRHLLVLRSGGLATPLAIRDRILENVPTVLNAKVFENEDAIIDADGVPGHNFEAVVLSEGTLIDPFDDTDDDEILDSVLFSKPAGIRSHGSIEDLLTDGQGFSKTIRFSRPEVGFLHMQITITPGEGFPTPANAAEQTALEDSIAQHVVTFLQRGGEGALDMGTDFVRFQVSEAINQIVDGVQSALIESDDTPNPGDGPAFSNADIVVDDRKILIADTSRTTVTIL